MKYLLLTAAVTLIGFQSRAEDCTKEKAQEAVEKACKLIEEKKEGALPELNTFRFCGDNYVWIQKKENTAVKMVQHPVKPRLNNQDITEQKDENGKQLFVEFDKAATARMPASATNTGAWVDYMWAKPAAEKATAKTSFVKVCPGGLNWIAGAGVWK